MSDGVKIALIGAGSAQFSVDLLHDILLTDSLAGSTIALMDVNGERLELVARLARRYVEELDAPLTITTTEELDEVLDGADFVVNTALAGGHPAHEGERALAERHGYYRGIRTLHMQRNLLLMLRVAQAVERVCPEAWVLQVSNPVFEGSTVMTRETSAHVVGLCHAYRAYAKLAQLLGIDPDEVTWTAPGFNHVIYLTEFRYRGASAYPLLDRWISESSGSYWARSDLGYSESDLSRAAIDLYRRTGYLPLGDTSRGFDTWWYNSDLETKKHWFGALGGFDSEIGWGLYQQELGRGLDRIRAAVDDDTPVSKSMPIAHSGENHIPLVDSLLTGTERVMQVNLPNRGCIEGLPSDIVVENKGLVANGGIELVAAGRLPRSLMASVFLPKLAEAERVLTAFQLRDRGLLREVLLHDHRTRDERQVDDLLADVFEQPYNAELAEWYGVR